MGMVCSSHKFIYFAGGCCATVAITAALQKQLPGAVWHDPGLVPERRKLYYQHMPAKIMRKYVSDAEWETFRFSFVRNPYSWVVSSFYHLTDSRIVRKVPKKRMDLNNFKQVLSYYKTPDGRRQDKTVTHRTQHGFLSDTDGVLMTHFIGKIENLAADWAYVCERIGLLQPLVLDQRNVTKTKPAIHWREHYTPETRAFVEKYWGKDIEAFGYTFG